MPIQSIKVFINYKMIKQNKLLGQLLTPIPINILLIYQSILEKIRSFHVIVIWIKNKYLIILNLQEIGRKLLNLQIHQIQIHWD